MEVIFALYIFPMLKTLVGSLIVAGLSYVIRKYRLDFLIGHEENIKRKILERAFHWEEQDKALKNAKIGGISGKDKFNKIVDYVKLEYPKLDENEIIVKIENVIGMSPQLGAFSDVKTISEMESLMPSKINL